MQINAIDVPPKLFERLLIPAAVNDELSHPRIPVGVRDWIAKNEGRPDPMLRDASQRADDRASLFALVGAATLLSMRSGMLAARKGAKRSSVSIRAWPRQPILTVELLFTYCTLPTPSVSASTRTHAPQKGG
jgi:hypothetical protein